MTRFSLLLAMAACAAPASRPPAQPDGPAAAEHARAFGGYSAYRGPTHAGHRRLATYVTLRDGVRLALDVTLPDPLGASERIPALLSVTPYWRSTEGGDVDARAAFFTKHGYAVVVADERGTGASFGTWRHPWTPESVADIGELVGWIAAQPWSDGRVGATGTSYVGTTALLAAATARPELRAVVPKYIENDVYADVAYPGGIYLRWLIETWTQFVRALAGGAMPGETGQGSARVRAVDSPDGAELRERALAEHRAAPPFDMTGAQFRDDRAPATGVTWDDFSVHTLRRAIERSAVPIDGWASWLDGKTAEAALQRFATFSNPQRIIIGAWSHGGGVNVSPFRGPGAHDVGPAAQALEELRFFDHHLRGIAAPDLERREIIYYTLGTERWQRSPVWPPRGFNRERWYLAAGKRLDRVEPAPRDDGADRHAIDFTATTAPRSRWHTELDGGPVTYGDRAAADRALLTYTSDPLAAGVEITGDPEVWLWVRSTADDGAFHVYLESVDPRGVVTHLVEGQLRARDRKLAPAPDVFGRPVRTHRRGDAAPLPPDRAALLRFALYPISVVVPAGHRLRVAIAGADAGVYERVPESGDVTITVERSREHRSAIDLPVRAVAGERRPKS